jgi:hypothetical protein
MMKCISVSAENPSQLCWVLDNQGHQLPGPVLCLALDLHRKPIGLIGPMGPMGPIRSCKDSISYAMLCLWPISIYKSPSQNASAPMAGKRRTLLDIAAAACTPPEAACAPETSHNKSSAHRIPPDPTGSHLQVIGWKANAPEFSFVTVSGRRMQSLTVTGTRYCGYSFLGWPRKISCAKPANFLVSTWDSTSPSLIHDALAMLNLL